jgi:serine/threonine protein kinase
MTLAVDTILENRYRIDRLIGQGGMGAIYQGYDTNLDIEVAIKENFLQMPQSIMQFQQEARILAKLHHPALPRVMHHFSVAGQQYLVMDFIEGEDLWQIIKRSKKPLDEAQAVRYISQICEAVQYLHKQQPAIIHRDIKPQNIKVTPSGQAVLVDFGIAKIAEQNAVTGTGARGVTPGFSPPEQYSGEGTTPRSDIYALGATLYALLTGERPPDSISLLTDRAKFVSPQQLNLNLSQQVWQAILHAMQPLEKNRPLSVAVWQAELQRSVPTPVAPSEPILFDVEATMIAPAANNEAEATMVSASLPYLVGPDGHSYPLKLGTTLTLGRAKTCDIPVEDQLASRQHATIEFNGTDWVVRDNQSANGTFINEQRLGAATVPLKVGDKLRIGQAIYTLSLTAASRQVATPRTNKPIDEQAETALATVRSAPPQSPPPTVVSPPVVSLPPARQSNSNLWMGIGAVVIVCIIIGLIMLSGGKESSVAATTTAELDSKNAHTYNGLCWRSSLFGKASEIMMDACNKAVELDPTGLNNDSRGLARALTGDYAGAIADFKVFVAWAKQNEKYQKYVVERERWITELEAGRNPFDEATLEKLRKEE